MSLNTLGSEDSKARTMSQAWLERRMTRRKTIARLIMNTCPTKAKYVDASGPVLSNRRRTKEYNSNFKELSQQWCLHNWLWITEDHSILVFQILNKYSSSWSHPIWHPGIPRIPKIPKPERSPECLRYSQLRWSRPIIYICSDLVEPHKSASCSYADKVRVIEDVLWNRAWSMQTYVHSVVATAIDVKRISVYGVRTVAMLFRNGF